jgi:hypothetical protein
LSIPTQESGTTAGVLSCTSCGGGGGKGWVTVCIILESVRNGSSCAFMHGVGCRGSGSGGVGEASCFPSPQRTRAYNKGRLKRVVKASSDDVTVRIRLARWGPIFFSTASDLRLLKLKALLGTSAVCNCRWPLNSIGAGPVYHLNKFSSATPTIRGIRISI